MLQSLEVDYVDESEVLTLADEQYHIDKHAFSVPFVCGCRNLGEALRRIGEGAAMIRTKGEAGTGNVVEVRNTPHIGANAQLAMQRMGVDAMRILLCCVCIYPASAGCAPRARRQDRAAQGPGHGGA